jgi:hypothetical protein
MYLACIDASVHRFYDLYIRSRHVANHLDFIFARMNWGKRHDRMNKSRLWSGNMEIATFHSSPLNIALWAIFAFLENVFDATTTCESSLSRRQYFNVNKLINGIFRESTCGMFSIDSMNYVLATCHFKKVVGEVNDALSMCNELLSSAREREDDILLDLATDLRTAMFDMRELSWQALLFCDSVAE